MARDIHTLLLFPEAFVMLVLSKVYLVTKGALVPEMAALGMLDEAGEPRPADRPRGLQASAATAAGPPDHRGPPTDPDAAAGPARPSRPAAGPDPHARPTGRR